jgi:4-hydroxybenzoate polyprenyltransferase
MFVFAESFYNQVSLDSKDVKVDRKAGLLTLPVIIGKKKSLGFIKISSVLSAIIFFLLIYYSTNILMLLLIVVTLLINQLIYKLITSSNKSGYILSAGKFLLWGLVIIVAQLIISF